jgi:hypothetical protein
MYVSPDACAKMEWKIVFRLFFSQKVTFDVEFLFPLIGTLSAFYMCTIPAHYRIGLRREISSGLTKQIGQRKGRQNKGCSSRMTFFSLLEYSKP